MPTLQGTLDEFITAISAIDGINYAPAQPHEQVTSWPAVFAYGDSGALATQYPAGMSTILHNIQFVVIMPLNDYRQAVKTMLPLCESVYHALMAHRDSETSTNYSTFAGISHELGPVNWSGGANMYGYIFTVSGVKIQNTY